MEEAELDADSLGPVGQKFVEFASKRMKGQETAIRRLAKALDHAESPLRQKDKPIYTVLLVGGAGSGKTHLSRVLAEFWFGNPDGIISVKCSEFQETIFSQNILISYDYAYQLNSGPHREVLQMHLKLTKEKVELEQNLERLKEFFTGESDGKRRADIQKKITRLEADYLGKIAGLQTHQSKVQPISNNLRSILVLDHIECANPDIQEALYDMLETGERVTYAPQEGYKKVSLVNSIIFITCSDWVELEKENPGLKNKLLGFKLGQDDLNKFSGNDVHLSGMDELKEYLSPKILSRIVRIEFLRPYEDNSRLEIVGLLIKELEERLAKQFPVVLKIEDEVKKFIITEGSDHPKLGIRLLKQKFDKYITWKLENLIQKGLVKPNDFLTVSLKANDNEKKCVVFRKSNIADLPR